MICAIILAAGRSRRMGSPKMLLPFGDKTIVAHVVDQVIAAPMDHVIVITPPHSGVAEALGDRPVIVITNPNADGDMLSSVRCGLRALPAQCRAVLMALGDQPAITSGLVSELIKAFNSSGRGIVVPTYEGLRGHPLLFSMIYRDEVLRSFDDGGLRGLLQLHPTDVLECNSASDAILSDMDTPEDYQRELHRRRSSS
jgi:molybdenum cofactor cytidylyltransferase